MFVDGTGWIVTPLPPATLNDLQAKLWVSWRTTGLVLPQAYGEISVCSLLAETARHLLESTVFATSLRQPPQRKMIQHL